MTLEDYIQALKRHDWTFEFSDDHSVWKRGRVERALLYKAQLAHDPQAEIWNTIAPAEHQITRNPG